MNQIICHDRETLLAWALQRASTQPDAVVAFLVPTYDRVRDNLRELHHMLAVSFIGGTVSAFERSVRLASGGRIQFYTFESANRFYGAEFSDAAIQEVSYGSAKKGLELVPILMCRLRVKKLCGAPNLIAYAD